MGIASILLQSFLSTGRYSIHNGVNECLANAAYTCDQNSISSGSTDVKKLWPDAK